MIYGTAVDKDVQELRDDYKRLTHLSTAQTKIINMNSHNIASLTKHVQDIADHLGVLRSSVNAMLTVFCKISQIEVVLQTLPGVETTVHSIVRENALIMQNIVHVSRGLVTQSFPAPGSAQSLAHDTGSSWFNSYLPAQPQSTLLLGSRILPR